MPIFRSKQAEEIDAVAARLAAARATLAAAENELSERAVEVVLNDDASTLATLNGRVAAARDRVALVALAHQQAVEREADRLAAARVKARQSEVRAAAQHAGRIERAAERYEHAVAAMAEAFGEMIAGGEAYSKLIPYPHNQNNFGDFTPAGLVRLGERELGRYRTGREIGVPGVSPPGAHLAHLGGVLPADVLPISGEIRSLAKIYGERFKALVGMAEPAPTTAPVDPEPVAPTVETEIDAATLAAGAVAVHAPVSAVIPAAEVEPVEPYQPGDPEYESYQAALIDVQRVDAPQEA